MNGDAKRRILDRPVEEILRPATGWVLPTAEHAVVLYEAQFPTDGRPRAAWEAAEYFAEGGRRGRELRITAWAAHKASSGCSDPALKVRSACRLLDRGGSVNPSWPHRDGSSWPHKICLYSGLLVGVGMAVGLRAGLDDVVGQSLRCRARARRVWPIVVDQTRTATPLRARAGIGCAVRLVLAPLTGR